MWSTDKDLFRGEQRGRVRQDVHPTHTRKPSRPTTWWELWARAEEYEFLAPMEEAPTGMLARGCHNIKACFTDADKLTTCPGRKPHRQKAVEGLSPAWEAGRAGDGWKDVRAPPSAIPKSSQSPWPTLLCLPLAASWPFPARRPQPPGWCSVIAASTCAVGQGGCSPGVRLLLGPSRSPLPPPILILSEALAFPREWGIERGLWGA